MSGECPNVGNFSDQKSGISVIAVNVTDTTEGRPVRTLERVSAVLFFAARVC